MILLGVLLTIVVFLYWQNNSIVISYVTYESDKVDSLLDGFTIVQISDLHNKELGHNQNYLMEKIKSQNPDLIVVTGDVMDSTHTEVLPVKEFFQEAVKIAPVYYVDGNHERWLEPKDLEALNDTITENGVTHLKDEAVWIETKNGGTFLLAGLNDLSTNTNVVETLLKEEQKTYLCMLLAHEPQQFEKYSESGFDLIFSGHAHGGQIRLPFIGGLVAPNQGWNPEYTSGKYEQNQSTLVVSRGLGNSVFPFRVFNRPEVVTITLRMNEIN